MYKNRVQLTHSLDRIPRYAYYINRNDYDLRISPMINGIFMEGE